MPLFVDDESEIAAVLVVLEEEEAFRGLCRVVAPPLLSPSSFMSVDVNIDDKILVLL